MKLKDTFMSTAVVQFALQTIFSIHNLEADNFFQPTTACEQFFLQKRVTPGKKVMVCP